MMERMTEHIGRHIRIVGCKTLYDTIERKGDPASNAIARLTAYEDTNLTPDEIAKITKFDGIPVQRLQELAKAEKDGRLVVLPCKDDTAFTIEEDLFNCDQCKNKANARYKPHIDMISCDLDNSEHCPLRVKEHKVEGFEISFKEGDPVVSLPGAYGYEGLETYSGFDGKCYYTREEAEAALKNMEAENES